MAKKRKPDATPLDEVDRSIYTTFCSAANSLSHLYTQTINQQKLSFLAGERHALDKVYQWILRQEEQGSRVATADLVAYLQQEIENAAEEPSMSPRQPLPNLHSQSMQHISHFNAPILSNPFAAAINGQQIRPVAQPDEQAKNSVFSSVSSSSVQRGLQPYQSAQGGNLSNNTMSSGHVPRDTVSPSSSDCMDIHADGPAHNFPY